MKCFKFKLYSAKRNKKLHRQIDAAALTWNHCIALERKYYRIFGKHISANRLKVHLTKLKKLPRFSYLKEFGSQAVQDVVERMDKAYKRFFDAKKNGDKVGLPGFKKIRKYRSYTLKQAGYKVLDDNAVVINGQRYCYFKSREIEGRIKTLTVKRDAVGDLWLCFCVEVESGNEVLPRLGKKGGFDFGLTSYLTNDEGKAYTSPQFFKANIRAVRRAHRKLSKKINPKSHHYATAKKDLARLYRRIANQRDAWQWQLAKEIVSEYAFIGLETLNIKAMQKRWGRKVSDYGFSDFVKKLEYVARITGSEVVHVDRWFASSQLCSVCGYKNAETKDLKVRRWTCPMCHTEHDRDTNAASNILAEALRKRKENKTDGASSVGVDSVRPAQAGFCR